MTGAGFFDADLRLASAPQRVKLSFHGSIQIGRAKRLRHRMGSDTRSRA
jgi:hypothetical protein